jgi:glycosyltransferase involved in cell wall biosynthesis
VRVALIVSAYEPAVGGVERHVQSLATGLSAAGDHVTVVTHQLDRRALRVEERDGVTIRRFPLTVPAANYRYSAALGVFLRRHRRQFDAVHVHSYHTLVGLSAVLAGMDRMVFTPHYHGTGHTAFRALLHKPYRLIARRLMGRSDTIVCVSRAEAALIGADFPASADRVLVIPNGTRVATPSADALREAAAGPGDVVSVGRLEEYKRHDLLVRAMALLPRPARLVIVGQGPARDALQRLAVQLGLADRVVLTGRLSQDGVDAVLASAGVVASMSELEAFGLSVADGLAAGARVVASDIAAHREVVAMGSDTGAARLIHGADPRAVAVALRQGLADGRPQRPAHLPTWEDVVVRTRRVYAR